MTRARISFFCVCVLRHVLNKPTCSRENDNPLIKNDRASTITCVNIMDVPCILFSDIWKQSHVSLTCGMSVRHHQNISTRGTGGVFRHTQTNSESTWAPLLFAAQKRPFPHPLVLLRPNQFQCICYKGTKQTAFVDVSDTLGI